MKTAHVFSTRQYPHALQDLSNLLSTWLEVDDVVSRNFTKRVLVPEKDSQEPLSPDQLDVQPYPNQITEPARTSHRSMKIARIKKLPPEATSAAPSGPYFKRSGRLHRVFHVYEDSQEAFFLYVSSISLGKTSAKCAQRIRFTFLHGRMHSPGLQDALWQG